MPWGGGGLIDRDRERARGRAAPETRVFACEPETGAAVTAALEAGEPREAPATRRRSSTARARKAVLPAMWERARPLLAGA